MTIDEVLQAVSLSLVALRGGAALDHYPSLRVKTARLNAEFKQLIACFRTLSASLADTLDSDGMVVPAAQSNNGELFYYRKIAPRMVENFAAVCEQLSQLTGPAPTLTFEELRASSIDYGFTEFNRLVIAVRQVIDNLVVDSYQFCILDRRELAFQILTSLLSFVEVAPTSLQAPIVTPELQAAAQAFAELSKTQRNNSHISKCQCPTFALKADYLGAQLNPSYHAHVIDNLHGVFRFCSEFAHVGYVSTLVTSSNTGRLFLGGPTDCFVPRFENFAKLKHRLLRECLIFLTDIYVPSLQRLITGLIVDANVLATLAGVLGVPSSAIRKTLTETDHEVRVQPIAKGLKESGKPIRIDCRCGGRCEWTAPYHEWELYCQKCGSRFNVPEVSPLCLYALSAQGMGDVVGAAGPAWDDLSREQRARIEVIWNNVKSRLSADGETLEFAFIGNPYAFDDDGKDLSGTIKRVPPKGAWKIAAMVAGAAMARNHAVQITCNCGQQGEFVPPYTEEVIECKNCRTPIGIFVVSGDPGYFRGGKQGTWRLYRFFGSMYKNLAELPKQQYQLILGEKGELAAKNRS